MILMRRLGLTAALFLAFQPQARAWSNHTLCTWQALAPMPEMAGRTVPAESLTGFLREEADGLALLLEEEERWARSTLPFYAPRPDMLKFKAAAADDAALKRAFLHAIRANENVPMELYVQRRPGVAVPTERIMAWSALTVLEHVGETDRLSLERVAPGEAVLVADVIATASNEPDFGMDIGLWQDNGAAQGALYAYGTQPFGNPRLSYSSQAPFHMGFYHESGIVYAAAPYLQQTYPEARIHLFMSLSRFAFTRGHEYWGWRFAGWAIHYVQDLAQPYHARVLPGIGTVRLLWTSALDMIGLHDGRNAAVNIVTNRHTVVENYQYRRMLKAYQAADMDDPLLAALRDTSLDGQVPMLAAGAIRDIVSAQSAAKADMLDAGLEAGFPAHYVSDPGTVLDHLEELDSAAIARQGPLAAQQALTDLVAERMRQAGRDTRALIRTVQVDATGPAATEAAAVP